MVDITYQNCTFHYRGHEVLRDLSFQVQNGEHTLIYGPIGSGKTMLLRSLYGSAQIKRGTMQFISDGVEISKTDFQNKVSLVEFAKPGKYFNPVNHFYQQRYHHEMEDDENSKSVTIEALLKAKGYEVNDKVVIELLKRENLENQLQRKLIQLSSGQRRKLQLILAMIQLPEILLLDAPYVGLDEYSRNDLNNWLLELAENHDLQLIITAKLGDAPEWIENKIALSADYKSNNNSEECRDALYNLFPKWKDESTRKTQIDLQQININYGKNIILEGLDLSVKEGDSIALIGANGAGKSTLLSLIYADNPKAYSNNVKMFGVKRGHGKSIWDIKKRIGFVSSELHLYFTEKYSCRKVIATGLFDTKFIPRKINAHEHQIIEHFAEYFNVKYLLDRNYPETSLCEQKLMLLIRALVKGPELLLLDEPYQAFSAELVAKANSLLNEIMKQSRTSLVFVTHYKEEIPASVQKIYHLKEGKLHLETVR